MESRVTVAGVPVTSNTTLINLGAAGAILATLR
jgi:hypothetical protein